MAIVAIVIVRRRSIEAGSLIMPITVSLAFAIIVDMASLGWLIAAGESVHGMVEDHLFRGSPARWHPTRKEDTNEKRLNREGRRGAPHRSLLYALGHPREDFDRPFIGVVDSYTTVIPGHMRLRRSRIQ